MDNDISISPDGKSAIVKFTADDLLYCRGLAEAKRIGATVAKDGDITFNSARARDVFAGWIEFAALDRIIRMEPSETVDLMLFGQQTTHKW